MNRIEELEQIITTERAAYYAGTPNIADSEFDELFDELKSLDPSNPVLNDVGSDLGDSNGFAKVKLYSLMGSQQKANTAPEMNTFIKANGKSYMRTYKMDGSSAELYYEHGTFVRGCSRGNGTIGVDYTQNISKMNGVVKQLSFDYTGVVKGEIVLSHSNKDKYFPEAKNCRNQATGIYHRIDGLDCDKLDFVAWDAFADFVSQEAIFNFLDSEGFIVTPHKLFENLTGEEAINELNTIWAQEMPKYDYDCDGLVWKKNEIDYSDIKNNPLPKTQIALKPAKTFKETTVTDIIWNVRNGTLTPIVQFEPIDLLGSTIHQATGNNVSFLESMKLEIGDKILITRGGEIIPVIAKNVSKNVYNPSVNF